MGYPEYISEHCKGEWKLRVRVQPGARKNELVGVYNDRLKLKIAAPAVDNKANKALVQYLAEVLDLRKSQISLTAGTTSRDKTLAIVCSSTPDWDKVRV